MSMHLVRGVQVHGKSKLKKKPGWKKAQADHNEFLKSMGIDPDKKPSKAKGKPLYETKSNDVHRKDSGVSTSDVIPANGTGKERSEYTGDYIVGIATMHKSNMVPVGRGDDPKAYAQMRRG